MKRTLIVLLLTSVALTLAELLPRRALAHAGSPSAVTWTSGQTLTSADLNNTIAHLHNTFAGGISDPHISGAAAIAHSKLATPSLVPKLQAKVTCAPSACSINFQSGLNISSVTYTGLGDYTVNLASALTDTTFTIALSVESATDKTPANMRVCSMYSKTTSIFKIACASLANPPANADAVFYLVLWDA